MTVWICVSVKFTNCVLYCLQIAQLLPIQKKYGDLKSQLELKEYDLSLFQQRAEQNEHHKVHWL